MRHVPRHRGIASRRALRLAGALLLAGFALAGPGSAFAGNPALDAALDLFRDGSLTRDVQATLDVGVDPGLVADLLVRAHDSGLTAADLDPVLDLALDAAKGNLPVDPLLGRYLQGLSKSVPLARIHPVARELLGRLRTAAVHVDARCARFREGEGPGARYAAIDHAAYALGVGLGIDYLDRSLELVAEPDRACSEVRAPVLAMGLLVSVGLEDERSWEVVSAAWGHGVRGIELERLGEAVLRLGQAGQPPSEIAARVLDLIEQELPGDAILRDLDALQGEIGDDALPPGPAGGDQPVRRRVPGDRPDTPDPGRSGDGLRMMPDQAEGSL